MYDEYESGYVLVLGQNMEKGLVVSMLAIAMKQQSRRGKYVHLPFSCLFITQALVYKSWMFTDVISVAPFNSSQYDESERRREMAKNSLERYTHYYERWATNQSVSRNLQAILSRIL